MMLRRNVLWSAIVIVWASGSAWAQDGDGPVRYDGYQVARTYPSTWAQIDKIHALGGRLMSEAEGLGPVNYLFPPGTVAGLDLLGVPYAVLNDNVQRDIEAERVRLAETVLRGPNDPNWFDDYKTYPEVTAKLNQMVADRPDLASLLDVGVTLESRHIYGIRITGPGTNKPAVLFNGCHHAREWISVMVPMWIADKLVYEYDTNPTLHSLVDRVEFFIIPVANVDGFVYTQTDRLWRKNRRLNTGGCYGVDDNRNYDAGWGTVGTSSNPCDETYCGTAAFSEPETAAMRDFAIAHPQIVSSQSYHSFSQLIMSSYGYTSALPADNATLVELDKAQHDAVLAVHGVQYDYGPIYSTIYPASGGDVDWYYDHEGIFSFTTELRDTSTFVLPPAQIIPTCEENFAAAVYLADWSASPVKISFPNGQPSRLTPGVSQGVQVKIVAIGATLDTASPRLYTRIGDTGAYTEHAFSSQGSNLYLATLPATPCGATLNYYVSAATTTGIQNSSPADAPTTAYAVAAAPVVMLLDASMDSNPGWTTAGQWTWGHPTGGGSYNHDPNNGHTGTNVYGYNLGGDYASNLSATYLTTPPINCTGKTGVRLEFWRWLGVESNSDFDKATVEVSGSNLAFTVIWQAADTGAAVSDSSWVFQSFDISAIADNTAGVKIRWGMGPTDGYVTYPGWNIDDVQVWAPDPAACPRVPGDMNCDGVLSYADINPFVLAISSEAAYYALYPTCNWQNADCNTDGVVSYADINPFVALLAK